jgi:formylglycine-generating enzyme required for sulfatase activity
MVHIANFCIDSTEVTVQQYTQFLAAKAGDLSGQPPKCLWNNSFVPSNWPPPGTDTQAVKGVDWCDAYMFCAWAGKRLCGNADGGSSDPGNGTNPAVSEWFKACSHNNDGLHSYPYGLTYDPKACNGKDYDAGHPLPSLSTCQGGYPGLFDMSGNVIEWEDSCEITPPEAGDQTGQSDFCDIRGGSFLLDVNLVRCDEGFSTARGNGGPDNGFRCCSK